MDRLTKYSKQTSHENGVCCTHFCGSECIKVGGDCSMNCKWEEAVWSRLAAYEDTGLTLGDIKELLDVAVSKTNKVLRLKEELHTIKNELCQYCGKHKQAHEGACDGCKWRKM